MNPPADPSQPLAALPAGLADALEYPFFQSVFDRKSRRMGLGMEMPGTLSYASPYEPVPLGDLEEALLLVAATGLNGLNLGDIDPSMGADALVQWTARTWPSSCSNHGTELFFTNDSGTYFMDMWGLMPEEGEIATLSGRPLEYQVDWIQGLVSRAKVQLSPERAQMPTGLPGLFVFNHWNANMPGTTLFLPVSNMTLEYINLLFIYFSPEYRFTLVDETNGYAPCGLERWIDGGRLDANRRMGIVELEQRVLSMQVVEQAFMCQNANLAMQAMGLGGWTYTGYIARYALGGMDVPGLGFRFAEAKSGPSVPVGRDGVFEAFTPPYHADMGEAVDAFLEKKWSQYEPDKPKAYKEPDRVVQQIARPDDETIQIVKDYCAYVYETYGRFPAYLDPMYQRLTAQAQHVDPDFYAEYYPPGALTDQHHSHFERWHPELAGDDGRPPRRAS
ncbi:MAG: hypothetical protein AB7V42_15340 [Thermoleophilia bacterium]